MDYLWYIPNQSVAGHRGDTAEPGHNSLDTLVLQAEAIERHGWAGALLGAGWGRPDTFTVAAALAARTTSFEPLIAIRPGYWQPALAASALATLDDLMGGRVRVNIVSGIDDPAAYGDGEFDKTGRYERTREFMQILRRLWTQDNVHYEGQHYRLSGSTLRPRPASPAGRPHPTLYFGGASDAAVLADIAERIARLKRLSAEVEREHAPLRFGLRITTLVRETSAEAWHDAEAKVARMAETAGAGWHDHKGEVAVGQQRLLDLQARGDVLDANLYTAPGRFGGGGAGTTWLVGSAEEVAASLRRYRDLGITHFILSDTPYLREIERQGRTLLPLLRD